MNPPVKNNNTTLHACISIAAFVLVAVGCKLLGLPDAITAMLSSFVAILLCNTGLMQAGDAATTEALSASISEQVNTAIDVEKAASLARHAESTAKAAALEAQVALIAPIVAALPLALPTVPSPPASPPAPPAVNTLPHLVDDPTGV